MNVSINRSNDALIYAFSSALTRGALLALSATSYILLTPQDLKMLGILISFSPLFTYLLDLALSKTVIRFWYENHTDKISFYIHSLVQTRFIFYLILSPVIAIVFYKLWPILAPDDFLPILSIISLIFFGLAESSSLLISAFCRLLEKPIALLKFKIFALFTALFISILSVLLGFHYLSFVLFSFCYLLISFLILIRFFFNNKKKHMINFDMIVPRKDILVFSGPLMIHDISWWLKGFAMSIIVSIYANPVLSSAFFLSVMIVAPFYILISGFDQAYAADFYKAKSIDANLKFIRDKYRLIIFVQFIFLIIFIFARIIKNFLVSDEIALIVMDILPILFLGPVFQSAYVVWIKPLMHMKKTALIGVCSFSISLSAFLTCYFLYPTFGIYFAAIITSSAIITIAISMLLISVYKKYSHLDVIYPLSICTASATLVIFSYIFI
jgi:O-antigen/teichoic acid export membrane protein